MVRYKRKQKCLHDDLIYFQPKIGRNIRLPRNNILRKKCRQDGREVRKDEISEHISLTFNLTENSSVKVTRRSGNMHILFIDRPGTFTKL